MWIGLVEHVALAVKHRVVDRLAINGVRRGNAQALVLKEPTAEVKYLCKRNMVFFSNIN
jgi:hypothetical protein